MAVFRCKIIEYVANLRLNVSPELLYVDSPTVL